MSFIYWDTQKLLCIISKWVFVNNQLHALDSITSSSACIIAFSNFKPMIKQNCMSTWIAFVHKQRIFRTYFIVYMKCNCWEQWFKYKAMNLLIKRPFIWLFDLNYENVLKQFIEVYLSTDVHWIHEDKSLEQIICRKTVF